MGKDENEKDRGGGNLPSVNLVRKDNSSYA